MLLVNNLGATTPLEMACVTREAVSWLQSKYQVQAMVSHNDAMISFLCARCCACECGKRTLCSTHSLHSTLCGHLSLHPVAHLHKCPHRSSLSAAGLALS